MDKKKEKNEISEAARKARNAYQRQWAKSNPDKVKEIRRRYWERKATNAAEG